MSSVFCKQFKIDQTHSDPWGRAKPSALLFFSQSAAEGHCVELGVDRPALTEKGLFWALIRNYMQIQRLPAAGETITVETWPMPTTRTAYPRSTVGYDETGEVLFRSVSLWVLMDEKTRAMVLPGKSNVMVDGFLRGTEAELPKSLSPSEGKAQICRQVSPEDLDINNHMNNARYVDWIYDLMPTEFHREHPLKEFTICYLAEALEGQVLSLNWTLDETQNLRVDASRGRTDVPDKQERIFTAHLQF